MILIFVIILITIAFDFPCPNWNNIAFGIIPIGSMKKRPLGVIIIHPRCHSLIIWQMQWHFVALKIDFLISFIRIENVIAIQWHNYPDCGHIAMGKYHERNHGKWNIT